MKIYRFGIKTSTTEKVLYPTHCVEIVQRLQRTNLLEAKISILNEKQEVDMKSILGLVSLNPKGGAHLKVSIAVSSDISERTVIKMVEDLKLGNIYLMEQLL